MALHETLKCVKSSLKTSSSSSYFFNFKKDAALSDRIEKHTKLLIKLILSVGGWLKARSHNTQRKRTWDGGDGRDKERGKCGRQQEKEERIIKKL